MGIPSETRDVWIHRSFLIPSPAEDEKKLRAKQYSREGIRAGIKAAAIAAVVSAVPTFLAVRKIPWAKANLNPTAQALIISGEFDMASTYVNGTELRFPHTSLLLIKPYWKVLGKILDLSSTKVFDCQNRRWCGKGI